MLSIAHYINGQMIAGKGSQCQPIFNPATGEITKQVVFATDQEINQAIAAAKSAFTSWSHLPPLKRARILFKFKELLEKNVNRLAELLTNEHGKVLDDAKGEVLRAIELVEFMCGIPHLLQGNYSENVGAGIDCYTVRQPLGVCVGITPFNFPVMITTWMAVPAIACGNTCIIKPSEKDPSSALLLCELMQQAGLPAGVFNMVHGDKAAVDQLITHPDISAVTCVGSTPVAEYVYQTAIQHGKRAHTFGGAKNHCIVMPDADIDETVQAIVGAGYGAAGERCMAVSVVLAVTDAVGDALIDKLKSNIPSLKINSGMELRVDMGPLITAEHLQRVKSYVDLGVTEGAQLLVDGREYRVPGYEKGFFLGACLFDRVTPTMRIYQEEIFGPVLIVMRVPDFESAVQIINTNPYGNGTAIFTQSGELAHRFASAVTVGMVGINVPIPVPVAYHAFGGWKRSIFGDTAMHGTESVHFYTKPKSITMRWPHKTKSASTGAHYHMPSH